jgi:hypothetical protein
MNKLNVLKVILLTSLVVSCTVQATTIPVTSTTQPTPSPTKTVTVTATPTLTPSPTNTPTPPPSCQPVNNSFDLPAYSDTDQRFPPALTEYLNTSVFATPTITNSIQITVAHYEGKIDLIQDITNDGFPELFIAVTNIPADDDPDLVGMWTHYLVFTCYANKYHPIYHSEYQNLYEHYQVEVIKDTNGNALPEIQIVDTYTHFETSVVTDVLEWNGKELELLRETVTTPTPF